MTESEKLDRLKPEINNLLLTFLPEDLTIREADKISMLIFHAITNPRDFLGGIQEKGDE